jgi:hypothetical protein
MLPSSPSQGAPQTLRQAASPSYWNEESAFKSPCYLVNSYNHSFINSSYNQSFVGPWILQFRCLVHSRTPWLGAQPIAMPLQTSMFRVGFEPTTQRPRPVLVSGSLKVLAAHRLCSTAPSHIQWSDWSPTVFAFAEMYQSEACGE